MEQTRGDFELFLCYIVTISWFPQLFGLKYWKFRNKISQILVGVLRCIFQVEPANLGTKLKLSGIHI